MGINGGTGTTTNQQHALATSRGGISRVAAVCNNIMSGVSATGVLLMVGGAVACYFGSRTGALVLLNSWLLWPLGAVACGAAVLGMRERG